MTTYECRHCEAACCETLQRLLLAPALRLYHGGVGMVIVAILAFTFPLTYEALLQAELSCAATASKLLCHNFIHFAQNLLMLLRFSVGFCRGWADPRPKNPGLDITLAQGCVPTSCAGGRMKREVFDAHYETDNNHTILHNYLSFLVQLPSSTNFGTASCADVACVEGFSPRSPRRRAQPALPWRKSVCSTESPLL